MYKIPKKIGKVKTMKKLKSKYSYIKMLETADKSHAMK
jgi:hypothetical protein